MINIDQCPIPGYAILTPWNGWCTHFFHRSRHSHLLHEPLHAERGPGQGIACIRSMAGWWFQPLWEIWKSIWDDSSHYINMEKHVPNHQPEWALEIKETIGNHKVWMSPSTVKDLVKSILAEVKFWQRFIIRVPGSWPNQRSPPKSWQFELGKPLSQIPCRLMATCLAVGHNL